MQPPPRVAREPDVLKALLGVQVLLVDHDPDARELLESVLSYGGAFVIPAATADEARAYLRKSPVDVIVVEADPAHKDAYWLVREIGARVPVVALGPRTDDGPERALDAAFRAHLHKPVDPWELCRVVGQLARKP